MENNTIYGSYELTAAETKAGLLASGRLKGYVKKSLFQTALAVAGIALFMRMAAQDPTKIGNWLIIGLCFAIIAYVWIFPRKNEEAALKQAVSGKAVDIQIDSEKIVLIRTQDREKKEIPLDKNSFYYEGDGVTVLRYRTDKMLIIPDRAFSEADAQAAKQRIKAATAPGTAEKGKR